MELSENKFFEKICFIRKKFVTDFVADFATDKSMLIFFTIPTTKLRYHVALVMSY